MLKLCFIAPSGYGKSTAISILKKFYNIENIKIAEPLYELQNYFYNYIDSELLGEQDGELLQFLGIKIRKENSNFLINKFKERVMLKKSVDFITNDDCRPPDYMCLKELGFVFVAINGYDRDRYDHSKANPKLSIEWQNKPQCDYHVDNWDSMIEYKNNLIRLIDKICKEKGVALCKKI